MVQHPKILISGGIRINQLNILADKVQSLRDYNSQGAIDLVTQQLQDIFEQLQKLIPDYELTACIDVFHNSSLLLEEKIEAIDHFLSQLTLKGKYVHFLQTYASEEILSTLISRVWQTPYTAPGFSVQFLWNSWNQLVTNKTMNRISRLTEDLQFPSERKQRILNPIGDPFETRMQNFFMSIKDNLPNSIYHLLGDKDEAGLYFERFSLVLHLLKNGKIIYDSINKMLYINPNYEETKK